MSTRKELHLGAIDNQLLLKAVNSSNNGIVITDAKKPDNPIIYVNSAFEKLCGYDTNEILGVNCRFLQGNEQHQKARQIIKANIENGSPCRVEIRNYRKDGKMFWNELSISPVHSDSGELTHFIGVQQDITKRKELEELIYNQSIQDPLTHLYNRRGFFNCAKKSFALAQRYNLKSVVIVLDIDQFKLINDQFGHEVGDNVLTKLARLLLNVSRKSDIVARFGGDEFVILQMSKNAADIEPYLKRLLDQVNKFNATHVFKFNISFSIGHAEVKRCRYDNLDKAIREADTIMYQHKRQKKT